MSRGRPVAGMGGRSALVAWAALCLAIPLQMEVAGAVSPEEEASAPGNYTGLEATYLARRVYGYPPLADERYIRYGAAPQGRRAVFDRLGQFVSYGTYGLRWNEVRDRYTEEKLDAGVELGQLDAYSGALIQNSFFQFLAVVRQTYGEEAMSIAVGRSLASSFTPLIFNQMQYGGLRVDYASHRHDLTLVMSRGGTLETTLFSTLRGTERDVKEVSPVLLGGANWVGHFGTLDLGATFFRQLQSNVKSSPESLWRGDVPYLELKSPKRITVRVSDDSPRDKDGVAVYDASMLVTAVVDSVRRRFTSDADLAGPDVVFDPTRLRMAPPVGRGVGTHWEAEGPDEFIDIAFELDPALAAVDSRVEVLADGDYRIAVRQVHDFDVPGTASRVDRTWPSDPPLVGFDGLFFEDYLRQDQTFYTVLRSHGSPVQDGAPTPVRFTYGIPTAQTFYGANVGFNTEGLTLKGELVYNPQDFKFPTAGGRGFQQGPAAGYLTALGRFGAKGNAGMEVFRIDPTYGGWYDSRRGGLVLFTDVAGDVFAGELRGTEARTHEFRAFDDNDDHDNWPDDLPGSGDALYMPQGAFDRPSFLSRKPDGGVFPGFDADGDHVVDFDRNRNGLEDFLEPFLGYDSNPPEFDDGDDFNNNLVPDYRENDDHPDYPYRRDQQGVHLFYDLTRRPWWLSRSRVGHYSTKELEGGHRSRVQYAMAGLATESPGVWLQGRNVLKRVRDDIPDDVYRIFLTADVALNARWNQPSRLPPEDFLPMRNSVVNTAYVQTGWLPWAGLAVTNAFKYVLNRRLDDEDRDGNPLQEAETLHNFSMVNKVSYDREVTPRLLLTGRVKHLLAKWDEGSYTPVDSVQVGQEASWSLLTPEVLVTYVLTPRTRLELGQHGLLLPILRTRFSDREHEADSYTQNVSILQMAITGEHGGYGLVAHMGLRRESRYQTEASGVGDTDLTAFFVDVVFGVE